MGVYIKGMEMPTSCWDCEVGGAKQMDNATCPFYSMEYWEQENYQDKIADGCPLVPVPTPHGRTIDADALVNKHFGKEFLSKVIIADEDDLGTALVNIPLVINNAPTIIPAEES